MPISNLMGLGPAAESRSSQDGPTTRRQLARRSDREERAFNPDGCAVSCVALGNSAQPRRLGEPIEILQPSSRFEIMTCWIWLLPSYIVPPDQSGHLVSADFALCVFVVTRGPARWLDL